MKQHKVEEEYVCMDDRPLIRDVERERVKELVESFQNKEENTTPTKIDERFEIGSRVWVSHRRGELYFEAAVQNDENDLWTVVRYLDDDTTERVPRGYNLLRTTCPQSTSKEQQQQEAQEPPAKKRRRNQLDYSIYDTLIMRKDSDGFINNLLSLKLPVARVERLTGSQLTVERLATDFKRQS